MVSSYLGLCKVSVGSDSLVPGHVIGEVDAVIIPTDIGHEHVERSRPFVEAGLPIFVDKPLVDNDDDLQVFVDWVDQGAAILSSSCMRYCKEFMPYRQSISNLGETRFVGITMSNTWERYGIHALEAVYPILGPGFGSVQNIGTQRRNVVHLRHAAEVDVVVVNTYDMLGGFGGLQICGTDGMVQAACSDTFYAFKKQLQAFVEYLRTGQRPFELAETIELMKMVIAGIRSREEGGKVVALTEIEER